MTEKELWKPRCFNKLRACEVVSTFDSFTGRDSRKPSAV